MTRLTVNFTGKVNTALDQLAEEQGLTKTEVLRRALSLYEYVQRETNKADQKLRLALVDEDENLRKEIVLH